MDDLASINSENSANPSTSSVLGTAASVDNGGWTLKSKDGTTTVSALSVETFDVLNGTKAGAKSLVESAAAAGLFLSRSPASHVITQTDEGYHLEPVSVIISREELMQKAGLMPLDGETTVKLSPQDQLQKVIDSSLKNRLTKLSDADKNYKDNNHEIVSYIWSQLDDAIKPRRLQNRGGTSRMAFYLLLDLRDRKVGSIEIDRIVLEGLAEYLANPDNIPKS
jgi:hypothetical protein